MFLIVLILSLPDIELGDLIKSERKTSLGPFVTIAVFIFTSLFLSLSRTALDYIKILNLSINNNTIRYYSHVISTLKFIGYEIILIYLYVDYIVIV